MPKISDRNLVRLCGRFWQSDIDFIDELCEHTGQKRNLVMRECIRSYVTHLRDAERRHLDKVEPLSGAIELTLDEDDLLELTE